MKRKRTNVVHVGGTKKTKGTVRAAESPPDETTVDDMTMCVVCLEDVDRRAPDVCTVAQCGHVLHAVCLQTWGITKEACPTCRGPIACQHAGAHSADVNLAVAVAQATEIVNTTRQLQADIDHRFAQALHSGRAPSRMGITAETQHDIERLVASPFYTNALDMLDCRLSTAEQRLLVTNPGGQKDHLNALKLFATTVENQAVAIILQERDLAAAEGERYRAALVIEHVRRVLLQSILFPPDVASSPSP
jgi:hypothetical protein